MNGKSRQRTLASRQLGSKLLYCSLDRKHVSLSIVTLSPSNNGHTPSELTNECVVIVDEISTQAPFHLAQLSWAIQQTQEETATSVNMNEFFGGIPAILSGDLNQLGPVKAGDCLTGAVMKVLQHKYGAISKSKRRRR